MNTLLKTVVLILLAPIWVPVFALIALIGFVVVPMLAQLILILSVAGAFSVLYFVVKLFS